MTTATKPVVEKRLWKFSVVDYGLMIKAGILKKEDRVELIDGDVLIMAPIGSRHAASVKRLNRLLMSRIGDDHIVGVQDPVDLNEYTEPEPDLTVVLARPDFYAEAHPRPSDIRLVIEVADSSLAYDRNEKVPRYSQSMIPEVWLVDVEAERVTVFTEPGPLGYANESIKARGTTIRSTSVGGLQVKVNEVFG